MWGHSRGPKNSVDRITITVNSREIFHRILRRDAVDRLLVDYWAVPEVDAKLFRHFEIKSKDELLDRLGIDFRYLAGPCYEGPELLKHEDGSEEDLWGVPRAVQVTGQGETLGSYKHVTKYPLADARTVQDVEHYAKWPDPDWFDYSAVYDQGKALRAAGSVRVFMGDRLNRIAQLKPAMYLLGVERALVGLIRKDPVFEAVRERIATFYQKYLTRILKAAKGEIDLIFTGDDFGTQNGPMFRPKVFQERLKPDFAHFIEIAHQYHVPVAHHTCGSIFDLIPDFIDAKLDILNPIQPFTHKMDFQTVKNEYGAALVFHGGISLQGPLRFGRPGEVSTEVRDRIQDLGPGGGYIPCTAHNIQADIPFANILALFEAYAKYKVDV